MSNITSASVTVAPSTNRPRRKAVSGIGGLLERPTSVLAGPNGRIHDPSIQDLQDVAEFGGIITTMAPDGHRNNLVIARTGASDDEIDALPTLRGKVFVVPNLAMSASNYFGQERYAEWVREQRVDHADILSHDTHDVEHDRFVQVWCHGEDSKDWGSHGVTGIEGYFPSHLPAAWFEGLNEGDIIAIVCRNVRVYLMCDQRGGRYSFAGDFGHAFSSVNKDYVPTT